MCRPCLPCTPHQWLTYGPLSTVQVFAFLREWLGRDEAWCSEGERLLWAITHAAAHTSDTSQAMVHYYSSVLLVGFSTFQYQPVSFVCCNHFL